MEVEAGDIIFWKYQKYEIYFKNLPNLTFKNKKCQVIDLLSPLAQPIRGHDDRVHPRF